MKPNTIYCGDCIEVMQRIPDNFIDMIFTSPPYNTGGKGKNSALYKYYSDSLSNEQYYDLLKTSIEESLRICKGFSFFNLAYMTNNKKVLFLVMSEFADCLREIIIWDKMKVQPPIGNILGKRYEFLLMFSKDKKLEVNNFRKNKAADYKEEFGCWISNLVQLSSKRKAVKFHQAVFPVELPSIFINIYTKPDDIILDPFMGSGTTCVAAKQLNRNYIGIEISPEYCAIAQKRIATIQKD